ncbi:MAG TPA: HupE/UreJ family protein [Chitinophagaceae bacterium]|nr:HupE/UreJ family protein [Chitinophagaceae bacterium]
MNNWWIYFVLGKEHIANVNGIDHMLFMAALCLQYQFKDWKKVLILITAFTIGHSITLALSTLQYIRISSIWIEFLIPVTILVAALTNMRVKDFHFNNRYTAIYFIALFFGFIHGLGFSGYLKSLLGKHTNIMQPLFAFNVGLEMGQIIIVLIMLCISFIVVQLLKIPRRDWLLLGSGAIAALALEMCVQRFP